MSITDNIKASLLAGAVGDSLGAPVEIFTLDEILKKTGNAGVVELLPYDPGDYLKWAPCEQTGPGAITDDTCMTAATLAGLLMAFERRRSSAYDSSGYFLHQAYLQWGKHQAWAEGDYRDRLDTSIRWPSWFENFCFSSGAGKNTLAALNSGTLGTMETPILIPARNPEQPPIAGEGCGGIMRTGPVGWLAALDMVDDAYVLGCKQAAITHGGRIAQTASGAVAVLIAGLTKGETWENVTCYMLKRLRNDPHARQTVRLAEEALLTGKAFGPALTFGNINYIPVTLGAAGYEKKADLFLAGPVMIQALAISAAAQSWKLNDREKLRHALTLAVTQSGDSDSVGSIVGNILGAQFGTAALPRDLVSGIQSLPALQSMASDIANYAPGIHGPARRPHALQTARL